MFMKNMFMKAILFCAAASCSLAANASYKVMVGSGFSAPTVCESGVSNMQPGDIIYDDCTTQFKGYGGVGAGWVSFSGSVALPPRIQTFTSGTLQIYNRTIGVKYIKVRMVGGGGGGSGGGTSGSTSAGDGGDTLFGTSLLVAGGGDGGNASGFGGLGGSASLGSGPQGTALRGGGGGGAIGTASTQYIAGPAGAASFFSGQGRGVYNGPGGDAEANSGAGGAGAGAPPSSFSGASGGSGGYVEAIITSPAPSYTYTVGAAGTAGSAGTGGIGIAGGNGGSGYIEVTEYYQ
jgi:hypothetical protein